MTCTAVDLKPFAREASKRARLPISKTHVIETKLAPDVWRALHEYAEREKQDPSVIAAEAVRAYLLGDRC